METKLLLKASKFIFLCLLMAISMVSAYAQNGTVQGKIMDDEGQVAPGINVSVQGTTIGTIADANGSYSLSVPAGKQKLQFSGVGYKTVVQEVDVVAGQTTTVEVTISLGVELVSDIIVTASRQPIRKVEATTAIDIIDNQEIMKQTPPTIGDALRFTPGVYVVSQRGRMRTNIVMRGFPENIGSEDKYTAMLIDGLPAFAGSGNAYDQFYSPDMNMERIEVVRGASATLFGRNAAAGVYNIIMKTGGEKLKGGFEQTFSPAPYNGKVWMSKTDLNLNGAITKDLRFNIGGFYLDDPGYRKQVAFDKGYQIRGNFDYLGKKLTVRVYGGYRDFDLYNNVDVPFLPNGQEMFANYRNTHTNWTPIYNDINYTRPTGITDANLPGGNANNVETGNVGVDNLRGNFTKGWNIGAKFNFDLGSGFSIQNHIRYQKMDVGAGSIIGFNYANLTTAQIFNSTGTRALTDLVNELVIRKEAKIGNSKHLFTLGGYLGYYEQKTRASGFLLFLNLVNPNNVNRAAIPNTSVPFPPATILRNADLDGKITNSAIFIGDEMSFMDNKLKVNVGLRYDNTDLNILNYLPKSSTGLAAGTQFVSQFTDTRKVNIGAISATVGANYLFTENSAMYLNVVRAFRAPDEAIFSPLTRVPNESVINYANANPNSPYAVNIDKPERITNLELGYRTTAANGDLNIDIAGYFTSITNRLISSFREVAPSDIRAVAISEGSIGIFGSELALTYRPSSTPGLTLRSNVTVQASEYTDFKNFIFDNRTTIPVAQRLRDVTSKRVKNIPGLIWNWGASYESQMDGLLNFSIGADGNYMADRYADEMNFIKLPNVMLINFNAGVKFKVSKDNTLAINYRMTNVFNNQKMLWMLDLVPVGTMFAGTPGFGNGGTNWQAVPGIPFLPNRSFITLTYNFQ